MVDSLLPDAWADEVQAAWGLAEQPFLDSGSDAFFFPGEQHLRALDFMRRVVCSRAVAGVVTGVAGSGKSLLVSHFIAGLDNRILLAHVRRSDLRPREFLFEILRQVGVELATEDRTDLRLLLQRYLTHQVSNGRICLLIIENAQLMPPPVLDELMYLAALQLDGARLVKMLLLGQPMLLHVVDSPRLSGLVPSGVPRVSVGGLSEDQLAAYVAHRLRVAGARDPDQIMPPGLMPRLQQLTSGIPALVNRLCSRALAVAAIEGESRVSDHSIVSAAIQLGLKVDASPQDGTALDAHADAQPELVQLLVSVQGADDQVVRVDRPRMLFGRSELADVCIESAFVSRYHALLIREPGQDLLVDLGSTNGVLVNAKRVVRHRLQHRDLIQIGPARLTYLNEQRITAVPVDSNGQTMSFVRPDFANLDHSVFAFGRFEDVG